MLYLQNQSDFEFEQKLQILLDAEWVPFFLDHPVLLFYQIKFTTLQSLQHRFRIREVNYVFLCFSFVFEVYFAFASAP